ncbi:MAG: UvrD-helicase domain-containing protein, partial [Chloroflexi bacterium]|nr:UvrD-helicase domain-containing protein [Chloroflexota bacterium]
MPVPADQPARDRIHHDLDTTLFVEAGAGTGKTRELIERIVRLVASGRAELRHIAAITFTEAAAAELRDRVRLRLEQAITEDSEEERAFPQEERERCRAALPQLDAAAIETLHGFAQRILTTHPLEAGLPPVLEIQDDVHATIAFDERWTAFLDELLSNDALEDTLLRAFVLGLQPEHLRQLALELHHNWDRLGEPPTATTPAPPSIDAGELIGLLADACGEMPRCQEQSDPLYQHLERVEAYRIRLAAAESELDTLRILGEPVKVSTGGGRKENWQGVTPGEVRGLLKEAQQLRDELLAEARAALLPPLLAELTRFILAYAGERRQQGRLEFHDLLVQARNLLRSDSAVRRQVRAQFTHLLIDEFQDTDPLQIEIAALLAGSESEGEPPDWQDAKIEPGRLFFVGDPKQSIYRFRRADINLYQRAQRQFVEGGVKLTQNFRSVEPVIAWLNHIFEDLMGDAPADGQAAYVPLAASWPAPDGAAPSVRLIGGPADENIGPIRVREADELVRAIQAAKVEGWPVTETD